MMKLFGACMLLSTAFAANAGHIAITGRIIDHNSEPVERAVVAIHSSALADTTGPDGLFSLHGTISTDIRQNAAAPETLGDLEFRVRSRERVTVSLSDSRGRVLRKEIFQPARQGVYRLHGGAYSAGAAAGVRVISIAVGDISRSFPVISLDRAATPVMHPRLVRAAKPLSRKAACTVGLSITAAGFSPKRLEGINCIAQLGDISLQPARTFSPGEGGLNLAPSNRQAPVADLPGFAQAGVGGGSGAPAASGAAVIDAARRGVVANDDRDDSEALQAIFDSLARHGNRGPNTFAVVSLPAGDIDIAREINIECDYVVIRGAGADPAAGAATRILLRPHRDMRYDVIDSEGVPDLEGMSHNGNSMGWNWPGRGAFRVQTTEVSEKYADDYAEAPANRKDIYEGSVNFHWTSGFNVDQDVTFAARAGDTDIRLDNRYDPDELSAFAPGVSVWVGAANSEAMYREQHVPERYWERLHMKTQIFTVVSVDASARTVTIDKPLEFDIPANSASDGSSPIGGSKPYPSRIVPLRVVRSVGFEHLYLTLPLAGLPSLEGGAYDYDVADATGNYGNMAPEYAHHGFVFKWAVDCWVRNVRTFMTGSHPVVTEQVRHLEILDSHFDGAWNKGGGGNGYVRISRAWDCIVYNNTLRNLRHLTLQWSSSGNVIIGNDMDCEINLHGGWERNNLIELNRIVIAAGHKHGACVIGCEHIDASGDASGWYPIYWSTGPKAGKWSGSSGPRNIFFNNIMKKQTTPGGPFDDYEPYYRSDYAGEKTIFQFGWDRDTPGGSHWVHLRRADGILENWADNETIDFHVDPRAGVNAERTFSGPSLFLEDAPAPADPDGS
jgi:hypothetical protein